MDKITATIGIDIGTTSVKIVAISEHEKMLHESFGRHEAQRNSSGVQDGKKIIMKTLELLKEVENSIKNTAEIKSIGVAGQMHGVILYSSSELVKGNLHCSDLYTWQYAECDSDVLNNLSKKSPQPIFPGFGCATLAHLQKTTDLIGQYDSCTTIMDLFIAYITLAETSFISDQNASSWGCYSNDCFTLTDQINIKFPRILKADSILPEKVASNFPFSGTKISVSMGDVQAACYPFAAEKTGIISISTSSQFCCAVDHSFVLPADIYSKHKQIRIDPYVNEKKILVAASVNGGSSVEKFIRMVQRTNNQTVKGNSEYKIDDVLQRINEDSSIEELDESISFSSLLNSERGENSDIEVPFDFTRLENVDKSLISLHFHIVKNLLENVCSIKLIKRLKIKKFILVGAASEPRFKNFIRHLLQQHYDCTVEDGPASMSAAFGIAKRQMDLFKNT